MVCNGLAVLQVGLDVAAIVILSSLLEPLWGAKEFMVRETRH